MSQESIITILSIAVTAVVAVAGYFIARQTEEIRIMRERLSEKKHKAYAEVVEMFYSILKDAKANKRSDSIKQMATMLDAKRDIFMYGSDKVFKAFNTWLSHTSDPDSNVQFRYYLKFMLEIRRDLCGNRTKVTEKDILLNLTQKESEADKLYN